MCPKSGYWCGEENGRVNDDKEGNSGDIDIVELINTTMKAKYRYRVIENADFLKTKCAWI